MRGADYLFFRVNYLYGAGLRRFFDGFLMTIGSGYNLGQAVVGKAKNIGTDLGAYSAADTAVTVKFKLHDQNLL